MGPIGKFLPGQITDFLDVTRVGLGWIIFLVMCIVALRVLDMK